MDDEPKANLQMLSYQLGQLQKTTEAGFRSIEMWRESVEDRLRRVETWQAISEDRVRSADDTGSPIAKYVTWALVALGTLLALVEWLVKG